MYKILMAWFIVCTFTQNIQSVFSQNHFREIRSVSNLIENDFPFSVHFPKFKQTFKKIRKQAIFSDHNFVKKLGILTRLVPGLRKELKGLESFLSKIETAHIFAKPSKELDKSVVVAMLKPASNASINNDEFQILNLPKKILTSNTISDLAVSKFNRFKAGEIAEVNANTWSVKISEWIIVSNSKPHLERIRIRLENPKINKKSLASNRRFKKVMLEIQKFDEPDVLSFCIPSKIANFLIPKENYDPKAKPLSEFSCAGLLIDFDNKNSSHVFYNCFTFHKLPITGLAANLDAYTVAPEVPPFKFDITLLQTIGWDPQLLYESRKRNYDQKNGEGSFLKKMNDGYRSTGLDYEKDIVDCFSSQLIINYRNKHGFRRMMIIKPVNNYNKALRYLNGRILSRNEGRRKYVRLDLALKSDDQIVFGRSKNEMKRLYEEKLQRYKRYSIEDRLRVETKFRKRTGNKNWSIDDMKMEYIENDGLLVSKNWFIDGDVKDIVEQLFLLNGENRLVHQSKPMYQHIKMTRKHFQDSANPFTITANSRAGDSIFSALSAIINQKHAGKREGIVKVLSGNALKELSKKQTVFSEDPYDILGYLFYKTIQNSRINIVHMRSKQKNAPLTWNGGVFLPEITP